MARLTVDYWGVWRHMAKHQYRNYFTGYIAPDWEAFPSTPYKGRGWKVTFKRTKKSEHSGFSKINGKHVKAREVIITASTYRSAQNVLDLINSSMILIYGDSLLDLREFIEPTEKQELKEYFGGEPVPEFNFQISAFRIPLACIIAAKASHRRSYKYALIKFRFASLLHSKMIVDLDPSLATEHFGVSPYNVHHVNFAYSILASYAVIEELGFEIRATSKIPSIVNGKWNPIVKKDLEIRLIKGGINIQEYFPWALRGKPTKVEMAKEFPSQNKCSWAKGPYVRDCEFEITDAIRISSFLRSKIAAHKMSDIGSSLTSYDAENVRHLARRLLLERLGFWPFN